MRSRCLLMPRHLPDFAKFCEGRGWVSVPTKGDYEVLRMRHPDIADPLMVYRRDVSEVHLTTYGKSQSMADKFFNQRRKSNEQA